MSFLSIIFIHKYFDESLLTDKENLLSQLSGAITITRRILNAGLISLVYTLSRDISIVISIGCLP